VRLHSVEIEGYRSFNERVRLVCDPHATVILAANDHGKTNLLEAIRHLNSDHPFDPERDLNWDNDADTPNLPFIKFELVLAQTEHDEIQEHLDRVVMASMASEAYKATLLDYQAAQNNAAKLAADHKQLAEELAKIAAESKALTEAPTPDGLVKLASVRTMQADKQKEFSDLDINVKKASQLRNTVFESLLEAIVAEIEASQIVDGTDVSNAASQGLARLRAAASSANDVISQTNTQLASEKEKVTAATSASDAAALKLAQDQVSLLDARLREATSRRQSLQHVDMIPQITEFIKSGRYKASLRRAYKRDPKLVAPATVFVERVGLKGELNLVWPDEFPFSEKLQKLIMKRIPRVELIGPVERIADAVNREEIDKPEFAFMRGVFYYAGLKSTDWDRIFEKDDVTTRRLATASSILDKTLQQSWSQGKNLKFSLSHDSKTGKIDLYIDDPVVTKRVVRASRRSTGFTHFFTLKTILHSRQVEAPASSYIWLFDEPGLYLHPNGQHDLLQVLETLAKSNQVLYSTHSLFMINKNFPTRHRLLVKSGTGTKVDGKPHQGQWKGAIEALGLALPGTILFANKVVLVEGDSDPIFLNAILLKLIELGRINVDLNSLAIMSTGDSKNADALIRILTETPTPPKIAALFDGDKGGLERVKNLTKLMKANKIAYKALSDGSSVEDHVLAVESIFVSAVANYIAKVTATDQKDLLPKFEKSFAEKFKDIKPAERVGVAGWSRSSGKAVGQLENEPSSVGIAREYTLLLAEAATPIVSKIDSKRAEDLASWIIESLDIPSENIDQSTIFEASNAK
jgi:predicted ATP-dependent endonuclease of OLD family